MSLHRVLISLPSLHFLCSSPFLTSSLPFPPPLSLSFSLRLPLLWLTSSAVLRPLHEANAHSGLAVAACMRSTGGPIKRRQEQETERDAGSARPQGLRRYHHCLLHHRVMPIPDPCTPSQTPSPRCVCTLTFDLQGLLCVSSGCWLSKETKQPENFHVSCVSVSPVPVAAPLPTKQTPTTLVVPPPSCCVCVGVFVQRLVRV